MKVTSHTGEKPYESCITHWSETLQKFHYTLRRNLTKVSLHTERNLTKIALYTGKIFALILYVPSTIFQLNREGSSWVEPVLS